MPWNESLAKRGSDLQQELAALLNPTAGTDHSEDRDARAHGENWFAFDDALEAEIASRLAALTGGILAYQHHPYRREQDRHTVVWQEGTTRLLRQGAGAGRPLLVVPSLINRYHVLDLMPGRSLLKHLAAAGYAPHVVDWGRPGAIERSFALEDYVDGRLGRALDTVLAQTGTRPHVIGYCMGGLLALALAQRRLSDIKSLVLLATPWDFAVGADSIAATLRAWAPWLNNVIDMAGELPTDIIQSMFFTLDPLLVVCKFLKFAKMDVRDPETVAFVALEDWINDGVPLAGPVAREALFGWYGANTPANGLWRIAGVAVDPSRVTIPSLALIPLHDRIVPPASASALSALLPRLTVVRTPLGHVGMVASSTARQRAWNAITRWLAETT